MTLVAPLKAFGSTDLAVAGGKGANLGELIQAGLPVPDGFVVTTQAYAEIAADRPIPERPAPEDGAGIRASFEAVEVPDHVRRAIAEAYAELGGGPVAVRSSATAEDLPGAAFAGQQDTYLNIIGGADLIDAVRRCWASLWTDRAIAYRRKLGIDSGEVRIAVVVQTMAPAETAGVMFTANPSPATATRSWSTPAAGSARRWSPAWSRPITTCSTPAAGYAITPRAAARWWSGRRQAAA